MATKKVIKSNNKILPENRLQPAIMIPKTTTATKAVTKHAMGSWGGLKFKVNSKELTALTDLEITDSYNDDYNEKGKKIGKELTNFSINVTFLASMTGDAYQNPRHAAALWREKIGKAHYFYVGGKKLFTTKFKLLGTTVNGVSLTNYGGMICLDMQLDFRRARTKAQEKAAQQEAKEKATTKSTTSTKTSSGSSSSYDGGKMSWPIPEHKKVSSNYGWRNCPYHGRELHSGADFPAPTGTAIKAAAPGKVVLAGSNGSYGNCVIISHGKSVWTLYGHASSLTVKKGQEVKAGQTIAKVGSTGNSTGPHLHFEVRKGANQHKNAVSPWTYISK